MGIHFGGQDNFVRIIELTPNLRRRIEATVEHLISILDAYAGDDDLEDGGDSEPSLGAPEKHPSPWFESPMSSYSKSQDHWADGKRGDHEREEENEHGGDIVDVAHDGDDGYEPSLGWTVDGQVGGSDDRERAADEMMEMFS